MAARPSALALLAFVAAGVCVGAVSYTAVEAEVASYLQDDPEACANCHVMREQLAGYERSSHRAVAVCNDCHAPDAMLGKWWTKATNGWHHSVAFTTGDFHEPIMIGETNRAVTEAACRRCHGQLTAAIEHDRGTVECTRCHGDVGHLH